MLSSGIQIQAQDNSLIMGKLDELTIVAGVQNPQTKHVIAQGDVYLLWIGTTTKEVCSHRFMSGNDVYHHLKMIIYSTNDWCIVYC